MRDGGVVDTAGAVQLEGGMFLASCGRSVTTTRTFADARLSRLRSSVVKQLDDQNRWCDGRPVI